MRFWATIRSPAFSISALIAPVKLRAVASGLIIEKVRSIAMISSLQSAEGNCGAYIGAISERQAISRRSTDDCAPAGNRCPELPQFHEDEPSLKPASRLHSRCQVSLSISRTPPVWRRCGGTFTDGATPRRTCGDDHVTQTLACCSCRGIAGCGRAGADFCFRLGRGHGWHHGGWGGGPRFFVGGPAYYGYGYGGCYVRRLVPTPWGPRWRLVNRCY